MSVYSIATQEAARSAGAVDETPAVTPSPTPPQAPPPALVVGGVAPILGRALDSIGTYIPTEVMATYLAILAVIPNAPGHRYQWLMFWLFLAATPLLNELPTRQLEQ